MKRTLALTLTAGTILAGGTGTAYAMASASARASAPASAPATVLTATVSTTLSRDLSLVRDEERMSRDLYTLFASKYGVAPFTKIRFSEQRHYDSIGVLLSRYGVSDPSVGKAVGVYANADIQKLFDVWKAQGLKSVTAAYQVGVELEKRDIADLTSIRNRTTANDVTAVLNNLIAGSNNHLAAYTRAVSAGTSYSSGPGTGAGPSAGVGQRRGRGAGGQSGMGGQDGGGYGRTGQRPAGCPLTSA
jgi:hypothetical protein